LARLVDDTPQQVGHRFAGLPVSDDLDRALQPRPVVEEDDVVLAVEVAEEGPGRDVRGGRDLRRIALPALLRRFPALRLTVAPEELPPRSDMTVYGVHELPVTW
jgi:hypothetical protein